MFIQTEKTPNPDALKFLPGSKISPLEPVFFSKIEETLHKSSLATKIFQVSEVKAVFYGNDFITVTKASNIHWDLLKPEILIIIMDHLIAQNAVFDQAQEEETSANRKINISTDSANSIEKEIIEIIETRVRPSVAMDGGDIIYRKFERGVVYLELHGACSGCPSSSITLKHGIESMLKHFVPEVQSVEAI